MSSAAPELAPAACATRAPAGRAWLALGGNQGAVLATFAAALAALAAAGAAPVAASRAYRTRAQVAAGEPPGPDYWNAACELRTRLAPEALLALCQRVERAAGRVPGSRWAPRPLDLDLLAVGRAVRRGPALTLPHPRLAERAFVLRPLAELPRPWPLPGLGRTPSELLAALPDPERGILDVRAGWWRAAI